MQNKVNELMIAAGLKMRRDIAEIFVSGDMK